MVLNKSLIFSQVPHGYPVPGKDLVVKTSEIDISNSPPGGITTKNLYVPSSLYPVPIDYTNIKQVSFDPYLRGRMRDASIKSYSPPFTLGGVINNNGVAKVVSSDHNDFKEGELVLGNLGFEDYSSITAERADGFRKLNNPYKLPLSYFTGVLGMPGLTAYSSFYGIGKPKKGETIFISAASGAVGQVVGQLAKHEGLKVVGSAGSDEKVEFVKKELGFDAAFNYKSTSTKDALAELCPEGIDIYVHKTIHSNCAVANGKLVRQRWGRGS